MTTRRNFIKNTAFTSTLAISSLHSVFGIISGKSEENPIIGHGNYKYKVDNNTNEDVSTMGVTVGIDTKILDKFDFGTSWGSSL